MVTYVANLPEDGILYFKLSELHQLYERCLQDLYIEKEMNKVCSMEQVLEHLPDMP